MMFDNLCQRIGLDMAPIIFEFESLWNDLVLMRIMIVILWIVCLCLRVSLH